jgi:hypothetical protein
MTKLAQSHQTAIVLALAVGALVAGAGSPAAAQTAVPCARPANAPPLVPVRLDRDGNFRIAPPYVRDPAFNPKPDVPKGRVIRFTMSSAESKLFPTAPVPAPRAGGPGRAGQAPAPANANASPAPQTPPCVPAWTDPAPPQDQRAGEAERAEVARPPGRQSTTL